MNIIFGLCGEGSRFRVAGYNIPKYLITVNNAPMIYHAVDSLRVPGKKYFVVKTTHLQQYPFLEKFLLGLGDEIIKCDTPTQGAAETLLLAKPFITDIDAPMISANCDQYMEWNSTRFLHTIVDNPDTSYILTYKETSPKCSYTRKNDLGDVVEVREKQVISDNATIGVYHWAKTKDFFTDAEQMIAEDVKENNEYYVAPVYNYSIARGLKVRNYELNNGEFWPIGTPEDLAEFRKKLSRDL